MTDAARQTEGGAGLHIELRCPVCHGALSRDGRRLVCAVGHSFDLARQDYVNLLRSSGASHAHGDDLLMVQARRAFLERGHYGGLREALCEETLAHTEGDVRLLDVGCGEGYYTCAVQEALRARGAVCRTLGVDISKRALIAFRGRDRLATLAVASAAELPVADGSMDVMLNLFAPHSEAEFSRVLRKDGTLVRAVPLEEHLMGLKEAVYDTPYANPAPESALSGFALVARREVRDTLCLTDPEDIRALFMMTPYYYKTGRADQEKLFSLSKLTTPIAFCLLTYRRL